MATDLFERDQALATLSAVLDAILDERGAGRGPIAVIIGEAGIGKTALVERFFARTRSQPSLWLLWASCEAFFTPRPLDPLYDIAQQTKASPLRALLNGDASPAALGLRFAPRAAKRAAAQGAHREAAAHCQTALLCSSQLVPSNGLRCLMG